LNLVLTENKVEYGTGLSQKQNPKNTSALWL